MRVLCTGVFGIVHAGHVQLFEYCKSLGTCIVGINGDAYCRNKYGDKAVKINQRIYVVESCRYVDEVYVFEEQEPSSLINKLRPDLYVKGPDYKGKIIPEMDVLKKLNIPIVFSPGEKIQNTSSLLTTNKTIVNLQGSEPGFR
jgi:cytidyltransferase-like protein